VGGGWGGGGGWAVAWGGRGGGGGGGGGGWGGGGCGGSLNHDYLGGVCGLGEKYENHFLRYYSRDCDKKGRM